MALGSSYNPHDDDDDVHDEWVARITEQNSRIYRVIKDVMFRAAELSLQQANHYIRVRRCYIERIREKGHESVFEQYFSETPIYPPEVFRTRYRIRKPLFEHIMNKLVATDNFFQQRADATSRQGMSAIQKCIAAMRVLAYGSSADLHDEYLRMSAQLIRKSVIKFVEGVIFNFGDEYLRKPTEEDIATLLYVAERHGFPGILGSIDCMHWKWKNCPTSWAGQYAGRSGNPTIILEVVVSQDLWIWHAFFGTPGSRNVINVFDRSPLFDDILEGRVPKVNYVVNGKEKNMGYMLNGQHLSSLFPLYKFGSKVFAQHQKTARKDVERAFGILQARFAFIKRPCLIWDRDIIRKIIIVCIIMHNMIVKDERSTYLNYHDPTEFLEDQVRQNNQRREEQGRK